MDGIPGTSRNMSNDSGIVSNKVSLLGTPIRSFPKPDPRRIAPANHGQFGCKENPRVKGHGRGNQEEEEAEKDVHGQKQKETAE